MYIFSAILVTIALIAGGGGIFTLIFGTQVDYLSITATMAVCIFLVVLALYFGVLNFLIDIEKNTKKKKEEEEDES